MSPYDPDAATAPSSSDATISSRGWAVACVSAATLVAATLLLGSLGEKGFWLDEALSVERAGLPWPALWRELTSSQANMGLYYVLLHPWLAFGTNEAAVRGLSMVFALLTLPAVWAAARALAGPRAAAAGVLLLSLNGFFIRYGQEARGYSLAVLLVTLATLAFARLLEAPCRRRAAAYAGSGALALYAHFFAALVLASHVVAALGLLATREPLVGRARGRLMQAWAGMAVLGAPLVWFVLFRDAGQIDWVPAPNPGDVPRVLAMLAGDGGWLQFALYAGAALAAFAVGAATSGDTTPAGGGAALVRHAASVPGDATSRTGLVILAAWLVVPVVLAFGVSMVKPVFQPRYLIVSLPAFVMLAGAGVARARPRALAGVAFAAMLVCSTLGVRAWQQAPERQFWRRAASFVMARTAPGDAVTFFVYSARVPFEYYVDRLHLRAADVPLIDLTDESWIAGNRQPDPSPAVLADLAARRARVWLVRLQDAVPPGHPLGRFEQVRTIETALGADFTRSLQTDFPGGIRVERWDRQSGPPLAPVQ